MVRRGPLVVVAVVAACGRLGFDRIPVDAVQDPLGHDEDDDGIADRDDSCPHMANLDQADGDGDGVGDVCDPHPAVAGDRITMFDPFVVRDPRWSADSQVAFEPDQVVIPLGGGALEFSRTVSDITFEIGGEVTAVDATGLDQLFLGVSRGTDPLWYGELLDNHGTQRRATVLYTQASTYTQLGNMPLAGPLQPGPIIFRVVVRTGPTASVALHVEFSDRVIDVSGPSTFNLKSGMNVRIFDTGFGLRIRYAIAIESGS